MIRFMMLAGLAALITACASAPTRQSPTQNEQAGTLASDTNFPYSPYVSPLGSHQSWGSTTGLQGTALEAEANQIREQQNLLASRLFETNVA